MLEKPKKTWTKNKATKRPTKKKSNTAKLFNLDDKDDDDESEVELDSLGSFFYILLTMTIIRMKRRPAMQMM